MQRRAAAERETIAAPDVATARPTGAGGPLDSFRIPSFRFQWGADALSTWAYEMESLILGWYILVETDSAFMLGLFGALRFGGTLLAPFFGVLADRVNRKNMLIGLRLAFLVTASSLFVLGITGTLQPWHAFVIATVSGLIRPSDNVVRQSLIADVVPAQLLMNATGLARTTQDTARIAGSLIGAQLLSNLGIGVAYLGVASFYLASVGLAFGITVMGRRTSAHRNPVAELKEGASYIKRSQPIMAVMFLAFLVNLTGFPLTNGLLPVVAQDVYRTDENGLAVMIVAYAAGALIGSIIMASVVRSGRPERMMVILILVWHVLLLAFAFTESRWIGLPLLALVGASISFSMIAMNVFMFTNTEHEFRGRVMGVRMLAVYGLPLGLLLGGWLAESFGIRLTIVVMAITGLVLALAAVLKWPELLRGPARERTTDH